MLRIVVVQWQKILNAINSGEMPPEDEPQIPDVAKTSFLDDLSNELVTARKILSDTGGRITMRRLNRREFGSALQDVTGVDVDFAYTLPGDSKVNGFDTGAEALQDAADSASQMLEVTRRAVAALRSSGPGDTAPTSGRSDSVPGRCG